MKKEYCPHCHQAVMKHKQSLSAALVRILVKVYVLHGVMRPFHLQRDCDLTVNQYANFQKLKYWKLVEKVLGRAGCWQVTILGGAFYMNQQAVPKFLWTFNNKAVPICAVATPGDLVKMQDFYASIEPANFHKPHEYAAAAAPVSPGDLFE